MFSRISFVKIYEKRNQRIQFEYNTVNFIRAVHGVAMFNEVSRCKQRHGGRQEWREEKREMKLLEIRTLEGKQIQNMK